MGSVQLMLLLLLCFTFAYTTEIDSPFLLVDVCCKCSKFWLSLQLLRSFCVTFSRTTIVIATRYTWIFYSIISVRKSIMLNFLLLYDDIFVYPVYDKLAWNGFVFETQDETFLWILLVFIYLLFCLHLRYGEKKYFRVYWLVRGQVVQEARRSITLNKYQIFMAFLKRICQENGKRFLKMKDFEKKTVSEVFWKSQKKY